VRDVVHEVAHGAPMEILERLGPADVAVVDLPQELLRVLVNAAVIGGDLQQDLLLFGDHDGHGGPPQVHLQSLGPHLPGSLGDAEIHADGFAEQLGLARVVFVQALQDGCRFALDRGYGEVAAGLHPLDQVAHLRQDLGVLGDQLLRGTAVPGRGVADQPEHALLSLFALEVGLQQRVQALEKPAENAQIRGFLHLDDDVPKLGVLVEDIVEGGAPAPSRRDVAFGVQGLHPIASSPPWRESPTDVNAGALPRGYQFLGR
jgi:hypothetical protein